MTRHELVFDITYSYYLEKMFASINGRIDKFLTLIILGSCLGAFSDWFSIKILAASVGGLSLIQLIFQYAKQAGIADDQAKKYMRLSAEANELTEKELKARVVSLQFTDSNPWLILANAAYKRACISLSLEDKSEPLTCGEKIYAWLAGEILPKDIKYAEPPRRP